MVSAEKRLEKWSLQHFKAILMVSAVKRLEQPFSKLK